MSAIELNNLTYTFTSKSKRNLFVLMALGLLLLILGVVMNMGGHEGAAEAEGHHGLSQRIWSNLLVNGFFFGAIALAATFFYAMQYAAQAAWSVVFQRIFSAVSTFLPVGLGILVIILVVGRVGGHHIYHWMDQSVYDPANANYDPILSHKHAYFADAFFWGRVVIFFAAWIMYQRWARKKSIEEDLVGGTEIFKKNITKAAIFLVFFGFTSSVFSWDLIMSIDAHWYSTLFGWYTFSGMWIGSIITFIMILLHLKTRGQMEFVNASHTHDLGKWMFAISFLWTYLWFAQFMLIWYSDIPEEVVYFQQRWDHYRGLFWVTMFVNFAFPMLMLMSRDAKRNKHYLLFVGALIFIFHWCDTFLLVMPGAVGEHWGIGALEIGMFLFFLGFFIFWIMNALSKAPLVAKNHPYLEEGLGHNI